MSPEIQEAVSFAKWALGGAGAALLGAFVLVWRASRLAGKLEQIDDIHEAVKPIQSLVIQVGQVTAVVAKLSSDFPRLERRILKVELLTGVVDTGKFTVIPPTGNGSDPGK